MYVCNVMYVCLYVSMHASVYIYIYIYTYSVFLEVTIDLSVLFQTRRCCEGFYGIDCLPCPGGFQRPCSKHGAVTNLSYNIAVCGYTQLRFKHASWAHVTIWYIHTYTHTHTQGN